MKKSIFAVAVASALTLGAAQAETVLYGSIRYDYTNSKTEFKSGQPIDKSAKSLSDLKDAGSRIGLKGSEDLGNGNAVIYNLEWGFDGMQNGGADAKEGFENRLAVLGLTGNWGTFTAGRQHNPFKVTVVDDSVSDDFNGSSIKTSAAQRAMTTTLLGGKYIADAKLSRVGKVVAYTTPDFAGFSANVAIMSDSSRYSEAVAVDKNQQKNIDLWTVNAKYAYELSNDAQILAKAGYINGKLQDNNSAKAWGLFLGYLSDSFKVTADYAKGDHRTQVGVNNAVANQPKEKSNGWDLGASYSFGANNFSTIRAAYGQNQVKLDGDKQKVKSWAVGFEQKLSTRTRAWVEYGQEKYTNHAAATKTSAKNSTISIGMRHDF